MIIRIFLSFLIFIASYNIAQADNTGIKTVEETCRVLATVIKTEQWLYAPYQNAPSTFSDVYTRLTLEIQDIQTFEKYRNAKDGFCNGIEKMSQQTYKLCAPVKPNLGDVIEGVIAQPVGLTTEGCLFDVKVTDNIRQ